MAVENLAADIRNNDLHQETPFVLWPSAVSWATASSENVLPAAITITFDSDALDLTNGTTEVTATLQITFFEAQGRQDRAVTLTAYCASYHQYMPLIR